MAGVLAGLRPAVIRRTSGSTTKRPRHPAAPTIELVRFVLFDELTRNIYERALTEEKAADHYEVETPRNRS